MAGKNARNLILSFIQKIGVLSLASIVHLREPIHAVILSSPTCKSHISPLNPEDSLGVPSLYSVIFRHTCLAGKSA